GGLLLEQIEELLFPREQAEHARILSRPPPDVNGGGRLTVVDRRRYDGAVSRLETAPARQVRCPRCARRGFWSGNPHRPFCSLECRLIDLGGWLDERYRIAGPELSTDAESPEPGTPRGG
ncbi:MAG TPA: DNA gyrase inhibitor YacG, partial [Methylomirabilota bacterium]